MISKPDLLFIKEIVEGDEKELQLSSLDNSNWFSLFKSDNFKEKLISDFSPNVETLNPGNFPRDLSLDTLVADILSPKYAGNFVYNALIRAPTDLSTIHYRWEILDELLQDRKKVQYINDVCDQLHNITELLGKRKEVERKLQFLSSVDDYKELLRLDVPILQQYVESINALAEVLGSSTSKGLASVYEYARKIKESDRFKFLSEQVNNFNNANYIELGVTINAVREVKKATFLDTSLTKLKRSTLSKIISSFHKPKWGPILNPAWKWHMSYDTLVAMAFSDLVEDSREQIQATTRLIGDIEFHTSGIKFYDILKKNNISFVRPELIARENRIHDIENMRNPMVSFIKVPFADFTQYPNHTVKIGNIVQNSMHVSPDNNIYVITGSNNGGKTSYVTSIGLMYVLAQSGYHIPAKAAKMSIIDNIYTHFVSPDDITKREGRWKNELRRIKPILERATPYSLCLIDDLGSGTNYEEAKDPILNIIYGFHRLNATTFMDTHIHEIANVVEQGEFSRTSNLQVEIIETEKGIEYTYKVIPGKAGKSYAKEIAADLGLNREGIDSLLERRQIPKNM